MLEAEKAAKEEAARKREEEENNIGVSWGIGERKTSLQSSSRKTFDLIWNALEG